MNRTRPKQAMSPRQVDRMEAQVTNLLRIVNTPGVGRLQRLRAGLQIPAGPSATQREEMTMSKELTQQLIGKLLTGQLERDAIHIAVMPVVADEDYVRPGERIKLVHGTTDRVRKVVNYDDPGHGVVDPYLSFDDALKIRKGTKFWMFLNPNTITGLRHEWTHPEIDAKRSTSESEVWLHNFADEWGFDYRELIETASNPAGDNDYVVAVGRDLHHASELGADYHLFWQHLGVVTERTYDAKHQAKVGWSCTC